jgi:hypothetical protein
LGVATWTEIPERRADGPGSEVMVLQRGAARCEVERDVDVGEPEDSAVVGEDEVEISRCYAVRFAVAGDSISRDSAPGLTLLDAETWVQSSDGCPGASRIDSDPLTLCMHA